jgi:hypothetical protein
LNKSIFYTSTFYLITLSCKQVNVPLRHSFIVYSFVYCTIKTCAYKLHALIKSIVDKKYVSVKKYKILVQKYSLYSKNLKTFLLVNFSDSDNRTIFSDSIKLLFAKNNGFFFFIFSSFFFFFFCIFTLS